MVTVYTTLQEVDGSFDQFSSNTYELNEAQLVALLNSDIVTYPRNTGNSSRSSVKTRIVEKSFNLFDKENIAWQIVLKVIE